MVSETVFRDVLRRHFTPARPISSSEYLRGREAKLRQIDRAFNSEGKHIFIYGDRGVGKTSLARTAALIHSSSDGTPPTIECAKDITAFQLLRDIAMRCLPAEGLINAATTKRSIKAGIPYLSGEIAQEIKKGTIPPINSVNDALAIVSYVAQLNQKAPIIIVDEFDVIQDEETRRTFASFMKHISDQEVPIKFIVCGIGDSLDEMIGSHLSTGRYLMPIELDRLPHDARFEIIASAADELGVKVDRETIIRIGHISDGFPYYVHLLGEKLFWTIWDDDKTIIASTPQHFEIALREASAEAEPSLKRTYELATQKYNDDYQQVLWAVADDSKLRRQMKDVYESYKRIMSSPKYRGMALLDLQKFYQRMNSLRNIRHGSILRTAAAGWYEFRENRLRGYVRLVAEREGVQLEPEHYLAGKKFPRFSGEQ
jgi:Cdc6-like AAA superfamily ATPase